MAFNEGFRAGADVASRGNPFSAVLKRVDEARARKMADDKDLQELKQLFLELGQKHEYEKTIEQEKGKQDRLTELFKGISSGQIEVDDNTAQDILGKFEQPQGQAQPQILPQQQGQTVEPQTLPQEQGQASKPVTLPDTFGLGKGINIKKGTSSVALTPEDALKRIPQGANPDDYEPKAVVRNIRGVPTEIYVANKKPEVIALSKKQNTLRIEAETQEKEINNMIDAVWSKAEELIPAAETGREGVIKGIERSYRASDIGRFFSGTKGEKGQQGEEARAFKDYQGGTLSILIRALGEKGVLTDKDIERSKQFEPAFSDSKILRKTKKQAMNEFLKSKVRAHLKIQGLQAEVEGQSPEDPEYDKMKELMGQ